MAGTIDGGKKTATTNKSKYGKDYYARIGRIGGRASGTGGFYANRALARDAGRKGGKVSRRGPAKKHPVKDFPLAYEIVNDSNEPLFEQTKTLGERISAWMSQNILRN